MAHARETRTRVARYRAKRHPKSGKCEDRTPANTAAGAAGAAAQARNNGSTADRTDRKLNLSFTHGLKEAAAHISQ